MFKSRIRSALQMKAAYAGGAPLVGCTFDRTGHRATGPLSRVGASLMVKSDIGGTKPSNGSTGVFAKPTPRVAGRQPRC